MKHRLSKSKILSSLQCHKRLYLEVYHKDLAEENDKAQRLYAIGHEVGELAQQLHPGGVFIQHQENLAQALAETQTVLAKTSELPLYEATFSHEEVLVRVDILERNKAGLVLKEVKAATSVKEQYYPDCAIQAWAIKHTGNKLRSIVLAHIDNRFVYEEEGKYTGLLYDEDITREVRDLMPEVKHWVKDCQTILKNEMPAIEVGDQCMKPYACPFFNHCNTNQTDYPVTSLPYGGKMVQSLVDEGIADIRDIPSGRLTSEKHIRVRDVVLSGKPFLDPEARSIVKNLPCPRYYLDFETISFAIPIWLGTRPYQQLPFQWSCHIEEAKDKLRQKDFLDISGNAPMRLFTEHLIATLGSAGPVIVYNAGFENGIMRKLAERFPDLAPALEDIIERVFDLLPVARNYYYHPDMQGSWSIKSVLPTIAPELDYQLLDEVQHGGEAQEAYLECIHPDTPTERKETLEKHLRNYCALDTLAMVRIAHYFEGNTN